MKLYTKVPIKDCIAKTGKQPIATRWIDVNKQDATNPLYRSRLIGKEFNTYSDLSLYAATPPIEALRLILHLAATNHQSTNYKIMTNDVSRAYFYAPIQDGQHIYVKLPPEDVLPGEEHMCGKLNYSMYGTRLCRHKLANALYQSVSAEWIRNWNCKQLYFPQSNKKCILYGAW